jgi:hypothetical protein
MARALKRRKRNNFVHLNLHFCKEIPVKDALNTVNMTLLARINQ